MSSSKKSEALDIRMVLSLGLCFVLCDTKVTGSIQTFNTTHAAGVGELSTHRS